MEFWINIAAGIALSAATWLLTRVLAPWYLGWRYKAPNLAGSWSLHDDANDEGAEAVGTVELEQQGERLRAKTTRTKSRAGKPVARSFDYRGKVRDGQILLTFEERSSNGFISGNLVLKVSGNQRKLSGFTVYLDRDTGQVVAFPIALRRV
jgi:hypothetical protein